MEMTSRKAILAILVVVVMSKSSAAADESSRLGWLPSFELEHVLVQTSLYTRHFNSNPDHTNQQNLISVELYNPNRWLAGTAWFKNSFDQPTWYFYVGREFPLWRPSDHVTVRAKLTAGLVRGYKDERQDNIPLNKTALLRPFCLASRAVGAHRG